MRVKTARSTGATDDICPNMKSKVLTVNLETGKISNEDDQIEQKQKEEETLRSEKSSPKAESSTRLLQIVKSENSACGFNLTRTKWDPYPWVSVVDADTPAEMAGLKVGDCVLQVNGKDVLGLRITEIAKLVRAKSEHVTLLLWSAGHESKCDPENLCDGPMPLTLQRLSVIVQSMLSIIECPVCLDTIPPPAMQCQNGHLLCVNCRIRAEKCPVCRDRYTPRRALIAEQIYAAITGAFNLCRTEDKLREKLFGTNVKNIQREQQPKQDEKQLQKCEQQKCEQQKSIVNTSPMSVADNEANPRTLENTTNCSNRSESEAYKAAPSYKVRIGLQLPTNKFLTKLLLRKACSMDNLSSATTTTTTTATAQAQSTNSNGRLLSCPATPSTLAMSNPGTNSLLPAMRVTSEEKTDSATTTTATQPIQSFSNQLQNLSTSCTTTTNSTAVTTTAGDCPTLVGKIKEQDANYLGCPRTRNSAKNKIARANDMLKHFSLSTDDLSAPQRHSGTSNSQRNATESDGFIIATELWPQCTPNTEDGVRNTGAGTPS